MPYERPTLTQLISRVEGDFRSVLGIVTILRRSFLKAFARAIAGVSHVLHGHLAWIVEQVFPDTSEQAILERQASFRGVTRVPATFAKLNVDFTGLDGRPVVIGTEFQRSDGALYTLDAEVTISGGTATGIVTASSPNTTELDSNMETGDELIFTSPIADVDSSLLVSSVNFEGEIEEDDDSLRSRLLARIQKPPAGGDVNDYIQWCLEVAGVTRAWTYPQWTGPGTNTVGVTFVEDGEIDIIPSAPKIAEVQAYIEEHQDPVTGETIGAPVTADPTVFAPNPIALDMEINIAPNNTAVQDAIEASLSDLIFRDAKPKGAWKSPTEVYTGTILISRIREAVSIAAGETDHAMVSPTADFTPTTSGDLVKLGTFTWGDV